MAMGDAQPKKAGVNYDPRMDAKAAPGMQPTKKGGMGVVWGCIGCISLPVVALLIFTIIGVNSDPKPYDGNNKYEAISQCEARIERLLKAPTTAQFDTDATGSGTWTVTGTVDSENGFGAMLRSDFQCTVEVHGDSATTTVDFLE